MAKEANFVGETIDRVQDAVRSVSGEIERLQEEADKGRKKWEKQTQERIEKLGKELRATPLGKRTVDLGKDATRQAEAGIQALLGTFSIASATELQKINRKLDKINRRLKKLEDESTPTPSA